MEFQFPVAVQSIIETLTKAGYHCQIVGGAVRDVLLGLPTKDWDFATDATPEQIQPLFQDSFYENAFGTVMVAHKHLAEQFSFDPGESDPDLIYDITTYRSDGTYRNNRHPETVTWGKSIEEDLERRDFTINAIAFEPPQKLIDPFHGQEDLEKKLIRTVGKPDERFTEDALRLLRAIRFCVQLGFELEEETKRSIQTHAELLKNISAERIGEETMKMIASGQPARAIMLMDELGILPFVFPELVAMKGVKQSGHHIYDVWEHSIRALESCPASDPVVRLATLLHDVAKPVTAKEGPNGTVTFYNHEVVGARIAKQVGMRLRLSKHDCDRIFTLVRWHMFVYEKDVTDAYIRRFIRRIGVEHIDDMMALRTGDRVGSGSKANSWRLEELRDRIYAELHQPLKLTDMVIDGNDVMQELSIKPGPQIGKLLNELFEDVLDHPDHNTREYLLEQLKVLAAK